VQIVPALTIAHRTSPTSIGSRPGDRRRAHFGFIDAEELARGSTRRSRRRKPERLKVTVELA
jgi:hypothetical protein